MQKDIVIIGGGPSGISTALHLARIAPGLAARTVVLEKAEYPRHKLCAGGLTVDAEDVLAYLGLDAGTLPHVDVPEVRFEFAGSGLGIRMPGRGRTLRIIRREQFDAWLADRARERGIAIREGVKVLGVEARADAVHIRTEGGALTAAVVVGADGANGIVRRCVLPDAPLQTGRTLELLVRPSSGNKDRDALAYFDFFPVPHGVAGYTWDFPALVDGEPMRCWGVYDSNVMADRERPPMKGFLKEEMARYSAELPARVEGYPERWFGLRKPISVSRVLLVGEAAGIDGFFGEGIGLSLGYGALAAMAIRDGMASGDLSFRGYRRQVLLSPLGRALVFRTLLTEMLYRLRWTRFQRWFWNTFKPVVQAAAMVFVLNWARKMRVA